MMMVRLHIHHNQIHFNYSLHQQTLEQVQSALPNTLELLLQTTWNGVNTFWKSLVKQDLDFLQRNLALVPRHTKEASTRTLVQPKL